MTKERLAEIKSLAGIATSDSVAGCEMKELLAHVAYLEQIIGVAVEALEEYGETHVWCLATMHVQNGEKGFELMNRLGAKAREALAQVAAILGEK